MALSAGYLTFNVVGSWILGTPPKHMKTFTARFHVTTGRTNVMIQGIKQKTIKMDAMSFHNWVAHVRGLGHQISAVEVHANGNRVSV